MDKSPLRVNIGEKPIVLLDANDHLIPETQQNNAIVNIRTKPSKWMLEQQTIMSDSFEQTTQNGSIEDWQPQNHSLIHMRRDTADRLAESLVPTQRFSIEQRVSRDKGRSSELNDSSNESMRSSKHSFAISAGLAIATGTILGLTLFSFYNSHDPTKGGTASSTAASPVAQNGSHGAKVNMGGNTIYVYQVGSFSGKQAEQTAMANLKNRGFMAIESGNHPYQLIVGATSVKKPSDSFGTILTKKGIPFFVKSMTIPSGTLSVSDITEPDQVSQISDWLDTEMKVANQMAQSPDKVNQASIKQQLTLQSKKLESIQMMGTSTDWKQTYMRFKQLQNDLLSAFDVSAETQPIVKVEHALASFYVDQMHLFS